MTLRMRKGDLVQVVSGSDKGKQGRITEVRSSAQKVRVEGIRMQKRHLKPGRSGARAGGIVEQEGFIAVSTVMLVDPTDDKPSRVKMEDRDGARVRVFVRSGNLVPEPTGASS